MDGGAISPEIILFQCLVMISWVKAMISTMGESSRSHLNTEMIVSPLTTALDIVTNTMARAQPPSLRAAYEQIPRIASKSIWLYGGLRQSRF